MNERRRVLLMIGSMAGGGSEQQVSLLLRHLDRQRFAPELYLTHRDGPLLSQVPSDVPIHSFDCVAQTGGLYYPGRVLRQQINFLTSVVRSGGYDAIYDRTFHMSLIAGPAAKRCAVPRVSTIVSPPDFALPHVEKKFVPLKRRRLAKAYRDSFAVVAVSQQSADSAKNYYGLTADRIHVIPNPVDAKRLEAEAQSPESEVQTFFDRSKTIIVCVGRMTAEKGHTDLIKALSLCSSTWPSNTLPMRVLLIGDGPLRGSLQQQADEQLSDSPHEVIFCGHVTKPAPAIAAADALILPSHFEGMPNVVLESMSLRTPVIATSVGGTVELQRSDDTILWAQANKPQSLADALSAFAVDRDSATRRADSALKYVQRHHDVQAATNRIEELLSSAKL